MMFPFVKIRILLFLTLILVTIIQLSSQIQVDDIVLPYRMTTSEANYLKVISRLKEHQRHEFYILADSLIRSESIRDPLKAGIVKSVFSDPIINKPFQQLVLNSFDRMIDGNRPDMDQSYRKSLFLILQAISDSEELSRYFAMKLILNKKFNDCQYLRLDNKILNREKLSLFATIFIKNVYEIDSLMQLSCGRCYQSNLKLIRDEIKRLYERPPGL